MAATHPLASALQPNASLHRRRSIVLQLTEEKEIREESEE
jgi:hypothetical protein